MAFCNFTGATAKRLGLYQASISSGAGAFPPALICDGAISIFHKVELAVIGGGVIPKGRTNFNSLGMASGAYYTVGREDGQVKLRKTVF